MPQDDYFRFAQALAADLNNGNIKLPSFPDVVMRIRAALDDPDTTGRDLANILSVDAVLAARILILGNSTYYNPGGIKIESIEPAVGRMGFEKIRTTAISYAVEQLHATKGLELLKDELRMAWSDSLRLAAMSEAIARHCTKLDADSAFIAGLLHRIGNLYIFTKHADYPELLQDADARQTLIDEWAAPIGDSIVAAWKFSEEIQATLNPDEVETTHRRTAANLADVVATAKIALAGRDSQFCDTAEGKHLQLSDDKVPTIKESYQLKLDSLASAIR